MKERIEINDKEIRKVVVPKVAKSLLIGDIVFWFCMYLLRYILTGKNFIHGDLPFIILFTSFLDFFISIILYLYYTTKEISKINENWVNTILSHEVYVQVLPNYTLSLFKTFINEVLPKKVDGFFAILDEKNQKVKIVLKFPDDDEYYLFTYSEKKDFPNDYKIIDNCTNT